MNYLILFSFLPRLLFPGIAQPGSISILERSELFIVGTSNVTDFRCDCTQEFGLIFFNLIPESDASVSFSQTSLLVANSTLDCGHRGMNRDMQKTLRSAEYPHIRLELHSARHPGSQFSKRFANAEIPVRMAITIAGQKRTYTLKVYADNLGNNQYRFRSTFPIKLSDFGLEAPSPMLGLVEVSDEMSLHFDLYMEVR